MSKKKKIKLEYADIAAYRIVLMFVVAIIGIWMLSEISTVILTPVRTQQGISMLWVYTAFSATLAAFGIYFMVKGTRAAAVVNGRFLLYAGAISGASCGLLFWNIILGMRLVYIILPAAALLYLIALVYQRVFTAICVVLGATSFALYLMRQLSSPYDVGYYNAVFGMGMAVIVVSAVLYFVAKKNDGRITVGKQLLDLFGRNSASKYMIYLFAACALLLIITFAVGGNITFYAFIASLVGLISAGAYYTVKLM